MKVSIYKSLFSKKLETYKLTKIENLIFIEQRSIVLKNELKFVTFKHVV